MEIYTNKKDAENIIDTAKKFGVDAQIIGRIEANTKKTLHLKLNGGEIFYD